MEIRISRILSDYYEFTRKEAEDYIRQGRVSCNGAPASIGQKASVEDTVLLDDAKVPLKGIFRKLKREEAQSFAADEYDDTLGYEEVNEPKSRALRKGAKNSKEKMRSAKKKGKLSAAPQLSYKQHKHRHRRFDFSEDEY